MEVLYLRCAGLDVHRDTVVACVRLAVGSKVEQHVETFGTTTSALLKLSDWLTGFEVTHVAMEATGVYWKPVWHVLEGSFELVLANAAHIKNVPGRKTDVNDATWIADLLAHGLIRGSFVPPAPVQAMRDLTRTRKQLVRERASHVQRVDKVLQDANLKLGSVLSELDGQSARDIIRAVISGETDPENLVELVNYRVKAPRPKIVEALRGRVMPHHRLLLKLHLEQMENIEKAMATIDAEVGQTISPFHQAADLLTTMPGIRDVAAAVIVAEVGIDMSRFPSAGHLVSWAGLCPRNDESAGKRRSTRLRKGAPWLKATLFQAAWAAIKTKGSYLRSQFLRLKARRGPKKAIAAVAASMLTAVHAMLRTGQPYRDLGATYFERRDPHSAANRLLRRLRTLGFNASLTPIPEAVSS
jgi:transposase